MTVWTQKKMKGGQEMIAEVILKVAGMESRESKYYPRPSLAGPERCLRQLCYFAQGYKGKPLQDRFKVVLDDSSWHEELTADWIRKSAYKLHSQQMEVICGEVPFNGSTYRIKGHIDGILTDLMGEDYLWEHKAVNHFTFQRYQKDKNPLDYLTQCAMYFQGLRKLQPDLGKGVLLIKNKNTSEYMEFSLSYDALNDIMVIETVSSDGTPERQEIFFNLYKDAIERFKKVEEHRINRTLPPRQYGTGDWQCEYCPYSETCYEGYEEEVSRWSSVALTGETAEAARKYLQLSAQIKPLEKELEKCKKILKDFLRTAEAKEGITDDGIRVLFSLQERTTINRELIPEDILKGATVVSLSEVLSVKGGRENGKGRNEA